MRAVPFLSSPISNSGGVLGARSATVTGGAFAFRFPKGTSARPIRSFSGRLTRTATVCATSDAGDHTGYLLVNAVNPGSHALDVSITENPARTTSRNVHICNPAVALRRDDGHQHHGDGIPGPRWAARSPFDKDRLQARSSDWVRRSSAEAVSHFTSRRATCASRIRRSSSSWMSTATGFACRERITRATRPPPRSIPFRSRPSTSR